MEVQADMAEASSMPLRRVRVFINPHSGQFRSISDILTDFEKYWDHPELDLTYQFSKSLKDGVAKVKRAIDEGVDTVLVVGGDGMVNSIGSALVGSQVALGVIPTGSGNGFARHFNIPLIPQKAVQALAHARRQRIDVGTANGRPFFVTCSLAWDAALVRTFEKSPVRGILPYVLAGAYELIAYEPQSFRVTIDGHIQKTFENPLVFTLANLTQFGGGARIAPNACPDDGHLELVALTRKDAPWVIGEVHRLFDGTVDRIEKVTSIRFSSLDVHRDHPAPVQVDGELMDSVTEVAIRVLPKSLTVLVPMDSKV